jgi:hypothetical protein
MKKSAIWVIALITGGALLSLTAGCGGGADDFEADTEKAIRLMDEGKNAEAFAILDKQCGSEVTLTVGSEDYNQCRALLGDAQAGIAGLDWLDFIANLPDDDAPSEDTGTLIVDVVADMAGAGENGLIVPEDLTAKQEAIDSAIDIHSNGGTITEGDLPPEQAAQLAMESMMYIIYEISGALGTPAGAPLTVETLQAALLANPTALDTADIAGINQALTYVDWGSTALIEQTGEDNSSAEEFTAFIDEITMGTGVATSASIANYITNL